MSKTNQTLQEILEDHTLRVGRQVTDSYKMKNGLWEGMSVQNVKSLNQALKEISELLVECSDVESISKNETFLEGYATAKDEIKANLLEALQ